MRSQREDEGWIRVWLALDAARCGWEGKKKDGGRRCLLWEKSLEEETYLVC